MSKDSATATRLLREKLATWDSLDGLTEDPPPGLRWHYEDHGSSRFPLTWYASLVRGDDPDADEILVVSVEARENGVSPAADIVLGADITRGTGEVIAEGPSISIPLSESSTLLPGSLETAVQEIKSWLDGQASLIQEELARAAPSLDTGDGNPDPTPGLKGTSRTVGRRELRAMVAEQAGLSDLQAGKAIDAILNGITDALARGEEVRLAGLGSFHVAAASSRGGRDPRTGKRVSTPVGRRPAFEAGPQLKLAART